MTEAIRLLIKFTLSVFAFSVGALAHAQPVERFAALPAISHPDLSPNGRWLSFECQPQDTPSVCILDLSTGNYTQVLPIPGDSWLSSAYFMSDEYFLFGVSYLDRAATGSGMRDYVMTRALAVKPDTGETSLLMRNQRWVTDNTRLESLVLDDPKTVLLEMVWRIRGNYDSTLYRIDLETGEGERLNSIEAYNRIIDAYGRTVARIDYDREEKLYTVLNAEEGGDVIFQETVSDRLPRFVGLIGGSDLLFFFSDAERYGYHRLSYETGEFSRPPVGALDRVSGIIFDVESQIVGFWGTVEGAARQHFIDEGLANDAAALSEAMGGQVLIRSMSLDRSRLVFQSSQVDGPASYYLYDRAAGSVSLIEHAYPGLSEVAVPPRSIFRYEAADGLEIEAILTLPVGWEDGDEALPLVVLPHGGPAAHDTLAFDWWSQAYAAQGYAVLQPNFRGSSGYGLAFQEAGYGEFGGLMIEDILDGGRALQAAGIAQEGKFCVAGGSYGGYAALMAGIRAPSEVACVVAFSPVTHPPRMLGVERRFGRYVAFQYWTQYMGDIVYDTEASDRISVRDQADRLTMPVLVLHGTDDGVVPINEAQALDRQMRRRPNYEFIRLEGETHFLVKQSSRQILLERSLELFEETLR